MGDFMKTLHGQAGAKNDTGATVNNGHAGKAGPTARMGRRARPEATALLSAKAGPPRPTRAIASLCSPTPKRTTPLPPDWIIRSIQCLMAPWGGVVLRPAVRELRAVVEMLARRAARGAVLIDLDAAVADQLLARCAWEPIYKRTLRAPLSARRRRRLRRFEGALNRSGRQANIRRGDCRTPPQEPCVDGR
jgi:hypothetical protein